MTARREGRPCWATVNAEALRPDRLARVLVEMGFNTREGALLLGTTTRGEITWWPPDYRRHAAWRLRLERSRSEAGRGFRQGAWGEDAVALQDRWDAADRAWLATVNRGLRDATVHLLARPAAPAFRVLADGHRWLVTHDVYAVDTTTGEWRSADGAQLGSNLLEMGMLFWSCRYGQAGARIARAARFRVPVIADPTEDMSRAA